MKGKKNQKQPSKTQKGFGGDQLASWKLARASGKSETSLDENETRNYLAEMKGKLDQLEFKEKGKERVEGDVLLLKMFGDFARKSWDKKLLYDALTESQKALQAISKAKMETVEALSRRVLDDVTGTSISKYASGQAIKVYVSFPLDFLVKVADFPFHIKALCEQVIKKAGTSTVNIQRILKFIGTVNTKYPEALRELSLGITNAICVFLGKLMNQNLRITDQATRSLLLVTIKTMNPLLSECKQMKEENLDLVFGFSQSLLFLESSWAPAQAKNSFEEIPMQARSANVKEEKKGEETPPSPAGSEDSSTFSFFSGVSTDHLSEASETSSMNGDEIHTGPHLSSGSSAFKLRIASAKLLHILVKTQPKFILNHWQVLLPQNNFLPKMEELLYSSTPPDGTRLSRISAFFEQIRKMKGQPSIYLAFFTEKSIPEKLSAIYQQLLSSLLERLPFNKWLIGFKRETDSQKTQGKFPSLTFQAINTIKTMHFLTFLTLETAKGDFSHLETSSLSLLSSLLSNSTLEFLPQKFCEILYSDLLLKKYLATYIQASFPSNPQTFSVICSTVTQIIEKASLEACPVAPQWKLMILSKKNMDCIQEFIKSQAKISFFDPEKDPFEEPDKAAALSDVLRLIARFLQLHSPALLDFWPSISILIDSQFMKSDLMKFSFYGLKIFEFVPIHSSEEFKSHPNMVKINSFLRAKLMYIFENRLHDQLNLALGILSTLSAPVLSKLFGIHLDYLTNYACGLKKYPSLHLVALKFIDYLAQNGDFGIRPQNFKQLIGAIKSIQNQKEAQGTSARDVRFSYCLASISSRSIQLQDLLNEDDFHFFLLSCFGLLETKENQNKKVLCNVTRAIGFCSELRVFEGLFVAFYSEKVKKLLYVLVQHENPKVSWNAAHCCSKIIKRGPRNAEEFIGSGGEIVMALVKEFKRTENFKKKLHIMKALCSFSSLKHFTHDQITLIISELIELYSTHTQWRFIQSLSSYLSKIYKYSSRLFFQLINLFPKEEHDSFLLELVEKSNWSFNQDVIHLLVSLHLSRIGKAVEEGEDLVRTCIEVSEGNRKHLRMAVDGCGVLVRLIDSHESLLIPFGIYEFLREVSALELTLGTKITLDLAKSKGMGPKIPKE